MTELAISAAHSPTGSPLQTAPTRHVNVAAIYWALKEKSGLAAPLFSSHPSQPEPAVLLLLQLIPHPTPPLLWTAGGGVPESTAINLPPSDAKGQVISALCHHNWNISAAAKSWAPVRRPVSTKAGLL